MLETELGGDPKIIDDPSRLPKAKHTAHAISMKSGYVTAIRGEQVGIASMLLGGGREKKEDSVDPAVGIVLVVWGSVLFGRIYKKNK